MPRDDVPVPTIAETPARVVLGAIILAGMISDPDNEWIKSYSLAAEQAINFADALIEVHEKDSQ